jgi:integrase-like protein
MSGLPENAVLNPLHWVQFGTHTNAKAEAFFSTLKTECFPSSQVFDSKAVARREIFEYIEVYYNNERLHSALGYQTPCQFETASMKKEQLFRRKSDSYPHSECET